MKKFRTRKHLNKRMIIYILLIIIFFFFFIIVSFQKLNKSYYHLISFIFNETSLSDEEKEYSLLIDFDYFINSYSFNETKLVYRDYLFENKIYLNCNSEEAYQDGQTAYDSCQLFQNNLKKLGLFSSINDSEMHNNSTSYNINIHRDTVRNTTITINNKNYAKIRFILELNNPYYEKNKMMVSKMNDYLNTNYPGLSREILEKKENNLGNSNDLANNNILIEIGGIENNLEEVNNSTEILSLMFYNIFGD